MKRWIITGLAIVATTVTLTGCASWQRGFKSISSEVSGGLRRKVEVYTPDGTLIDTIEGKIDIQDTDYGNKVLFDVDGNRYIYYNCSVVVKEK